MKNYPSLDDKRSLSIDQFCEAEDLTHEEYLAMRTKGFGPDELRLCDYFDPKQDNHDTVIRIAPSARRKWHAALETRQHLRKMSLGMGAS